MSVIIGLTPKFKTTFSAMCFDGQHASIGEFGLKLLILRAVNPVMVVVTISLMSVYCAASTTSFAIVSLMPIDPV